MNELIDYSRQTGTGPMESLINFPRRNSGSSVHPQHQAQQQQNQANSKDTNHNNLIASDNITQLSSNGATNTNNFPSSPPITAATNSQQDNQNGRSNGLYNTPQMPSTSSSGYLSAQAQHQNPSPCIMHVSNHGVNMQANSQSSVNKILGMVSQMNAGNEMMGNNGISSGMGFGNMNGLGLSATAINANNINRQRVAMMNNVMGMNSMAMNHHLQQQQQQDMGSRLMNNLRFNNNYSIDHFDRKE